MSPPSERWTFLTNHARVLRCLAEGPDLRMRDVAQMCGLTERCVQRIVAELAAAGYLAIAKDGRRNRYEVAPWMPLRHPLDAGRTVGETLGLGEVMALGDRKKR